MSVVITMEAIEELVNRVENTPQDNGNDIRPGDWVKFNEPMVMEAYQQGVVVSVKAGNVKIRHGSMVRSSETGTSYRRKEYLAEHWRRHDVVKRDSFEHDGKTISVTSVEYEWVQIA